jgi:hypothetical protein
VTFSIFLCFLRIQPLYFKPPDKAVILSEAPRRSIANRELYGAESKDPGDACWQMLLGAFRPQTTTENKKSQTPSVPEGSAVPRTSPANAKYYAQTKLSSRPERTRISCHAALDKTACAPFLKRKAHDVCQRNQHPQEIRGSAVERSAVLLLLTQTLKPHLFRPTYPSACL